MQNLLMPRLLVGVTIIVVIIMVVYSRNFHPKTWIPEIVIAPNIASGFYSSLIPAKCSGNISQTARNISSAVSCEVPSSGFRGWTNGVVTALRPKIERNCTKLFAGDEDEIKKIKAKSKKWKNELTDNELLKMTEKCSWVVDYFCDNMYTTTLERSFPIAYTFIVYDNPQQVLRLLKVLYRPTNVYLFHPDERSKLMVNLFQNLAACLTNVRVASRLIKVTWGKLSLLQAQLNCLQDLVHWRSEQPEQEKWKYVINLCGKEIPLKSTHTIVSYLAELNGTSSVIARHATDAYTRTRLRGKKVPHDYLFYKSMTYTALSYKFVHFLQTNSTAIELYHFFEGCAIPEEHYYATVYMIPGVPGGFNPSMKKSYFRVSMYTWLTGKQHKRCRGRNVHSICIVTVGDLRMVTEQHNDRALFHNKYFMQDDHTIMDCMEERLIETNKKEFRDDCNHTLTHA